MTDLTPASVEAKLSALVTELTRSQQHLATARDAETQAEIAYRRAKVGAFHSPQCPKVSRGGYTVADRDAWVDAQTIEQWHDLRVATTAREIAADALRTVRDVAEVMRSLSASVRTAYALAGTGER